MFSILSNLTLWRMKTRCPFHNWMTSLQLPKWLGTTSSTLKCSFPLAICLSWQGFSAKNMTTRVTPWAPSTISLHSNLHLWGPFSGWLNPRIGCQYHCWGAFCPVHCQWQWVCPAQCHCGLPQGSQWGHLLYKSGQDHRCYKNCVSLHMWIGSLLWIKGWQYFLAEAVHPKRFPSTSGGLSSHLLCRLLINWSLTGSWVGSSRRETTLSSLLRAKVLYTSSIPISMVSNLQNCWGCFCHQQSL